MLKSAMGIGHEDFGEAVIDAAQDPRKAIVEAADGVKRNYNESLDRAQERIARGDDFGAAFGFTVDFTAPTAATVVGVAEGTAALGQASRRRVGPSLDRMRVAMREATEAQARKSDLGMARTIAAGRRGELGAVGRIMSEQEAAAAVSADAPPGLHFDPPLQGVAPNMGASSESSTFSVGRTHLSEGEVGELLSRPDMKITNTTAAGAARPPRHHVFIQEERGWFNARGIDIDKYTLELTQGEHSAAHTMGWNARVKEFIADEALLGRPYTRREILKFGAELRREFGFGSVKAGPFER
jgi:hypothetical protein